ncbi:MAG: hypothetical protein AAGF91_11110, partial [Actinomycetota bacterium]
TTSTSSSTTTSEPDAPQLEPVDDDDDSSDFAGPTTSPPGSAAPDVASSPSRSAGGSGGESAAGPATSNTPEADVSAPLPDGDAVDDDPLGFETAPGSGRTGPQASTAPLSTSPSDDGGSPLASVMTALLLGLVLTALAGVATVRVVGKDPQ